MRRSNCHLYQSLVEVITMKIVFGGFLVVLFATAVIQKRSKKFHCEKIHFIQISKRRTEALMFVPKAWKRYLALLHKKDSVAYAFIVIEKNCVSQFCKTITRAEKIHFHGFGSYFLLVLTNPIFHYYFYVYTFTSHILKFFECSHAILHLIDN